LVALRARIASAVQSPQVNPVALAALTRQLVLISAELEKIDARDDIDGGEAALPEDQPWDGAL
jgi:hypothetical protein